MKTFFPALVAALVTACSAGPTSAPPPMCAPASNVAPPSAAQATPPAAPPVSTPEEALARLFTAPEIDEAWLAPSFAEAVPARKVEALVATLQKQSGPFVRVEKTAGGYTVVLANATLPAKIALDGEHRITGLLFSPPEATHPPSRAEVEKALGALHGKVSWLVVADGKDVTARDADAPLAVGSAFKLAILDALREKIDAKKAKWSDVVPLQAKHKSLPSGALRTWPEGSPLTLHTLAALMISVSDNTAADALLDYVGRENAEKRAPTDVPFLSTREMFTLKAKGHEALLSRWRAGDAAARRTMLPEIGAAKLSLEDVHTEPSVDVEWHLSARTLCGLLAKNGGLDVLRINPGVAKPKDWDVIAYKGGSEPGVLNLSTWVERGGKKACVVTTWNDARKDVDLAALSALHGALLDTLR